MFTYENPTAKMKLFCSQKKFFFRNFDFKNDCKNEFKDTNEKLCS